ncbi:TetR/AcrR family transcriptional regulator C-terminal domain-containing protein [Oscillibacter sp. MSJ-2]|uniref:TetR/AcrR family transcriptional regulator C-terminal domain-containing protein n=1 Tax=Dysosmobacter acutus TaxID=2841504 RepID=A0ABS6FBH8_9FIRM|nr:TetR/AcrR family transcriptional regulator C-terminal domain-containing protein [Dysosmobacter acutus]MBU5626917.1 TetR/AcrR family transcriptional regulator C-terminal domain-containing protein [Dysosmobacter acutus]
MAQTTKRALADSMKKLLAKSPLDKITVKDLVEDCGVNRQTFYYHFHDVYDLVEWIFREELAEIAREEINYSSWSEVLYRLADHLTQNRALILNVYNSVSHGEVTRYVNKAMRPYVAAVVEEQAEGVKVSLENREFVTDLCTRGAAGLMCNWIETGMRRSQLLRLEKFERAVDGSLRLMLKNFEEK